MNTYEPGLVNPPPEPPDHDQAAFVFGVWLLTLFSIAFFMLLIKVVWSY